MRFHRLAVLLAGALSLGCLLSACQREGVTLPATVEDIKGHRVTLRGHWVILNYWASWCSHCRREVAALNQLYREAEGQHALLVIGVNDDGLSLSALKTVVARWGMRYPNVAHDPVLALHPDGLPVLPVSYLFSPQGRLLKKWFGEQNEAHLRQILSYYRS